MCLTDARISMWNRAGANMLNFRFYAFKSSDCSSNLLNFFFFDFPRKWIDDSYAYWDNLRQSCEASLAGVAELSAYIFSSTNENIVRVCNFCFSLNLNKNMADGMLS